MSVNPEQNTSADSGKSGTIFETSGIPNSSANSPGALHASTADPELARALEDAIAPIAKSTPMEVGVAVIDLETGTTASFNADTPMVSASMIKMIVAEAFLKAVADGEFSLDDTYALQGSDIVGGTGSLGGRGAGAAVTYRELVQLMISDSDNTACNILINTLGMDVINAEAKRLGLESTQVNRLMMDTDAIAAGIENYVSASDMATLFEQVYRNTFVNRESSELVLAALEQQTDRGGIAYGLAGNATFAHKTGSLSNARLDGGIVEGERPYVIVVLCGGNGFSAAAAEDLMAQIALAVDGQLAG